MSASPQGLTRQAVLTAAISGASITVIPVHPRPVLHKMWPFSRLLNFNSSGQCCIADDIKQFHWVCPPSSASWRRC
jgi:hypothetical protein